MMNKSKILRILNLSLFAAGLILIAGNFSSANAQQRDPFEQPAWAKPKTPKPSGVNNSAPKDTSKSNKSNSSSTTTTPAKPQGPTLVAPPPIQQRVDYYKRLRETAVISNQPIPKLTSVLTLDEMSVTGIFRTPRGYAAMVEAKPVKLSYTVYPGEKFFDGQLVAIEENKLVFRRVSKWSNGKFVASEENKPLRQYTVTQEVNGTAPVETTTTAKTETPSQETPQTPPANNTETKPTTAENKTPAATPSNGPVVSPLEEMLRQPQITEKPKDAAKNKLDKKGKPTEKKTVKVADNKKPAKK